MSGHTTGTRAEWQAARHELAKLEAGDIPGSQRGDLTPGLRQLRQLIE